MPVFSIYATSAQIAYWDEHKVEVCTHVRNGDRPGYCLGPECRPCLWRRAGVDPQKIAAYESYYERKDF